MSTVGSFVGIADGCSGTSDLSAAHSGETATIPCGFSQGALPKNARHLLSTRNGSALQDPTCCEARDTAARYGPEASSRPEVLASEARIATILLSPGHHG